MKKILTAALAAALLIVPFSAAAAPDQVELPLPPAANYVPGTAPAEVTVAEAMTPAVHAAMLAMLNHQVNSFAAEDTSLTWETLYNMLSMYGQLDDRAEYQGENLLIPAETVLDYAAALLPDVEALGQLPETLADRMTYDAASDSYLVVCGNDEMAEVSLQSAPLAHGRLLLTGALVSVEDGSALVRFQAVVKRADNLLGCELISMDLL